MQLAGPLRKSVRGAVHTLLRDSYSEPYFISWCESPQNECSRHSRVSATPFHRRGWWTRSSRRPRLPPCGPSRMQKPAQQKQPAALRRLSYVRKSAPSLESFLCTHPAPIQPRPPLLPPASLQGAPPTAGLTPGAGRTGPTLGLSAHGVPHSPSRSLTAPRRTAPSSPCSLSARPFRRTPHAGAT